MGLPPGPHTGLPLVGDLKMFSPYAIDYTMSLVREYGSLVTIDYGPKKLVFMIGPKYNHYILSENADNFLSAPMSELTGGPIFGHGVLFMDGPAHKQARRMLHPAFHKKRVENYLDTMVEETNRFIAKWSGEIDLSVLMHQLTLNIVGKLLFDINLSDDIEKFSQAWHQIMNHNGDPLGILLAQIPFSDRRQGNNTVNELIYSLLEERRANPGDKGDVVSMLLAARDEDGTTFSDQEIRDHLMILFLAGHETSANGLAWMFYLLAQHPIWATSLLEEIQTVLGNGPITMDKLDDMPTLEMIIKETLRLLPPVPGFTRSVANDFEIDGYQIPAGTMIYYGILGTHLMPELYPDPDVWKPERFAPDAERKYNAYEYLPFGAATRLCLGMPMAMLELKVVLCLVLQKYRLDLVADQEVSMTFRGTLTPLHGIQMRVSAQDGQFEHSPATVYGNVPGATPKN